MFCERCGRLRNRATGRCVCDDDPSLATPVEQRQPVAVAATANGSANGSVNGSANGTVHGGVDVAAPSTATASADVAPRVSALATPADRDLPPLPQQISRLNGARPKTADEEHEPEPEQLRPLGRLRTVLPDMRDGFARVDVRIHEDALVIDRVRGVDPVLVGRIAGTLLLGPLGLIIGDALGRKRAHRQRLNRVTAPGMIETGERLPLEQLVAVTVQRLPWGGTVRIGAGGGSGARTLRWSKRDLDANDVAGQLQAVATRRFSVHAMSNGLRLAHRIGVALLVLAAIATVALPAKAILLPPPAPGEDLPAAAREAMENACPAWRAAPLSGPALAAVAIQIRPDLERAAAAAPEFATLVDDIAAVEGFAPKAGSANAPLAEAARFSSAVDSIDSACTRVGQ